MLKKVMPTTNYGQVAAWLVPVLGDELAGAPAGSAVDSRALALLEEVDPNLASDLTRALWAAHWVLPLLALRLPPTSRLSTQRRELALNRCVNPPLLLRPLRMPLRGIARALKLLVVFSYFTQDSAWEAVGYVEMHLRPRARGLDPSPPSLPATRSECPVSRRVDIAIAGAGAAGCVLAYRLTAAGLSVHVVERGHRLDPSTVRHNEFDMLPRVYKNGGPQATDDRAISILQGAGVGGSTVINNAIWLRAELDRLLPEWAALGAHVERAALDSAYTQLEELLHVSPVPLGLMTKGTNLFTAGCDKLELPYTYLNNNRAECTGCGWCNYACRYNRKTSALVTFAPWAEHYGAVIEDQCADVRLTQRGNRITGLSYTRARRRYQLDADHVIVSCGAIGSSAFLLQNGVTCRGQVGRRFHVLGGVLVTAFAHDGLESYDGIGLTCMTRPDTRYLFESFYATPGACAVTMPGWGRTYGERMSHYASGAQAGAMVATGPHGRIRLRRDGSTRITVSLTAAEVEATALGQELLARIYLAGGAETVTFGLLCETTVCSENDIVSQRRALRDRSNLIFGSAHAQGGNTMSDDPGRGVVDSRFRVHGLTGLSVIDASILPTNLFANCQATVMALGWVAADKIVAGHQ